MEQFSFAPEVAFVPRGGVPLEGMTIAPLTPPISDDSPFMAAIFRFAPGAVSLDTPGHFRRSSPSSTGLAR